MNALDMFLADTKSFFLQVIAFVSSDTGMNYIFLALMLTLFMLIILNFIQVINDEKYERAAFTRTYKRDKGKNFFTDVILKDLKSNIVALNQERGKTKEDADNMLNIILAIIFAFSIFMFFVQQPVFAILLPVVLLFVVTKITGLIKKSFSDYVMAQLPSGIDSIIRCFSGYNDLKSVLYDAGSTLPMPMRGIFQDLSRKMQTESADIVLEDFMDTSKDIWIYCLSFNLLSYVEDSNKKDVIANLRELKEVIDRDNREKQKQKVERKLTTSINYVLCFLAVAGFFANLIFNRAVAYPFFFSTVGGLGCFLGGMALVITSIFSNLLIGSGKD